MSEKNSSLHGIEKPLWLKTNFRWLRILLLWLKYRFWKSKRHRLRNTCRKQVARKWKAIYKNSNIHRKGVVDWLGRFFWRTQKLPWLLGFFLFFAVLVAMGSALPVTLKVFSFSDSSKTLLPIGIGLLSVIITVAAVSGPLRQRQLSALSLPPERIVIEEGWIHMIFASLGVVVGLVSAEPTQYYLNSVFGEHYRAVDNTSSIAALLLFAIVMLLCFRINTLLNSLGPKAESKFVERWTLLGVSSELQELITSQEMEDLLTKRLDKIDFLPFFFDVDRFQTFKISNKKFIRDLDVRIFDDLNAIAIDERNELTEIISFSPPVFGGSEYTSAGFLQVSKKVTAKSIENIKLLLRFGIFSDNKPNIENGDFEASWNSLLEENRSLHFERLLRSAYRTTSKTLSLWNKTIETLTHEKDLDKLEQIMMRFVAPPHRVIKTLKMKEDENALKVFDPAAGIANNAIMKGITRVFYDWSDKGLWYIYRLFLSSEKENNRIDDVKHKLEAFLFESRIGVTKQTKILLTNQLKFQQERGIRLWNAWLSFSFKLVSTAINERRAEDAAVFVEKIVDSDWRLPSVVESPNEKNRIFPIIDLLDFCLIIAAWCLTLFRLRYKRNKEENPEQYAELIGSLIKMVSHHGYILESMGRIVNKGFSEQDENPRCFRKQLNFLDDPDIKRPLFVPYNSEVFGNRRRVEGILFFAAVSGGTCFGTCPQGPRATIHDVDFQYLEKYFETLEDDEAVLIIAKTIIDKQFSPRLNFSSSEKWQETWSKRVKETKRAVERFADWQARKKENLLKDIPLVKEKMSDFLKAVDEFVQKKVFLRELFFSNRENDVVEEIIEGFEFESFLLEKTWIVDEYPVNGLPAALTYSRIHIVEPLNQRTVQKINDWVKCVSIIESENEIIKQIEKSIKLLDKDNCGVYVLVPKTDLLWNLLREAGENAPPNSHPEGLYFGRLGSAKVFFWPLPNIKSILICAEDAFKWNNLEPFVEMIFEETDEFAPPNHQGKPNVPLVEVKTKVHGIFSLLDGKKVQRFDLNLQEKVHPDPVGAHT